MLFNVSLTANFKKKPTMFRLLSLIILLFAACQISSAQDYMGGGIDKYMDYARIDKSMMKPATYNEVQGSPFLYKDFTSGDLKLNNGTTYKGSLRYDIYADQIEFRTTDGEIYAVKNPESIQLAILDDKKFNYFEPGEFNNVKGYYEVLVIGNYSLYEKYQVVLKDPEAARPYVEAKPAKFIPQDSKFLIMDPDGKFTEINNKKDLLLKSGDQNKIDEFLKEYKIKPSKKEDLIRFVEFLNK